jgi:hypothetical protein
MRKYAGELMGALAGVNTKLEAVEAAVEVGLTLVLFSAQRYVTHFCGIRWAASTAQQWDTLSC